MMNVSVIVINHHNKPQDPHLTPKDQEETEETTTSPKVTTTAKIMASFLSNFLLGITKF